MIDIVDADGVPEGLLEPTSLTMEEMTAVADKLQHLQQLEQLQAEEGEEEEEEEDEEAALLLRRLRPLGEEDSFTDPRFEASDQLSCVQSKELTRFRAGTALARFRSHCQVSGAAHTSCCSSSGLASQLGWSQMYPLFPHLPRPRMLQPAWWVWVVPRRPRAPREPRWVSHLDSIFRLLPRLH